MSSTLAIATRGYWQIPQDNVFLTEEVVVVVSELGVNPNEIYVGETSQPIAIELKGVQTGVFNTTAWNYFFNMEDRDTAVAKVANGVVRFGTNDDGKPILYYDWVAADVDTAGRYFYQFRAVMVSDSGKRYKFTKLPLVIRSK